MRLLSFEVKQADLIASAMVPPDTFGTPWGMPRTSSLKDQIEGAPWWAAVFARFALFLVWLSPLLLGVGTRGTRRFVTFGALSEPQREEQLEFLLEHQGYVVREATMILKLLSCIAFFEERGRPLFVQLGVYDLKRRP